MSRALWFVAGASTGIYAMAKARRAAEALTPEGLADRLSGLSLGAHLFGQEVRAGMTEKQVELRGRLGLADRSTARDEGGHGRPDPPQPAPVTARPRAHSAQSAADPAQPGPDTAPRTRGND